MSSVTGLSDGAAPGHVPGRAIDRRRRLLPAERLEELDRELTSSARAATAARAADTRGRVAALATNRRDDAGDDDVPAGLDHHAAAAAAAAVVLTTRDAALLRVVVLERSTAARWFSPERYGRARRRSRRIRSSR